MLSAAIADARSKTAAGVHALAMEQHARHMTLPASDAARMEAMRNAAFQQVCSHVGRLVGWIAMCYLRRVSHVSHKADVCITR